MLKQVIHRIGNILTTVIIVVVIYIPLYRGGTCM